MNPLVPLTTAPVPATAAELHLRIHDVLASAKRLWLRGRLLGLPATPPRNGWFSLWKTRKEVSFPTALRIETHVGGKVLRAEPILGAHGDFEALFTEALPEAGRDWRVARNQVHVAGQTIEGLAVVAAPPADAAGVVVVVLPRADTMAADGPQRLLECAPARLLAGTLERLHQGPRGGHSLYYMACTSSADQRTEAEWALALTALGWPAGHVLLVPTAPELADVMLAVGIDRLRWLFAGNLDIRVLNLDPKAANLKDCLKTEPDRAAARLEMNAGSVLPRNTHLRPARSGRLTKYPLVFCHGMLAMSMLRMQLSKNHNYFSALGDFLEKQGFQVLFPLVVPTGGVVARAKQLREQILGWTDEPVNVIAHSMGGLDARYMITHLGMADRVRSLTTVSTPHRGTYTADWFAANYRSRVPLLLALETMGVNVDGFRDCQRAVCKEFNARTLDMPGVRYFSYAGEVPQSRVTPMLRRGSTMLTSVEGPNDGLVSVASAKWGEFLGKIYADHFAQTPDGLFVRAGESFDSLTFFTGVVDDLARRGF